MPDPNPQQAESENGAAPAAAAGDQTQSRTPEQVEAEWQAKQSALGRQHAATEQTLRARIAALEAQTASGERTGSEQDAIQKENELLRKQLADRETAYNAELRKVRFPLAAEALDAGVLATMDEAKLAGLEARLTPQAGVAASPRMETSTPPRTTDQPKPLSEKTAAELKADLARLSPQFLSEIRAQE